MNALLKPSSRTRVTAPGELWRINDGDPFPAKEGSGARILEIKQGWVRYALWGGCPDYRLPVPAFTAIYSFVSGPEKVDS